jgi:hypothetical protein
MEDVILGASDLTVFFVVGKNIEYVLVSIRLKMSLTLAVSKFSCRLMKIGRSGSPLSCLLNGASTFCSGTSLGLQGVSYMAGQTAPESAFGFYLASLGFSIAADTLDEMIGIESFVL